MVTPPATACAGGATPMVRVRAVDTECSVGAIAGYTPTKSAEKSLTVNCITPPLTIVSNRTPQGGPISLYCGQRLEDEQVQPGFGAIPGNGSFSNFAFTIGGIVSSTGSLNTRTPVLSVSGPGTGTIGLSATYSRNGASTAVAAAPVSVTVRPELATPVFALPNYDLCLNETKRFAVAPVPGATSYQWTVSPANLTPTGPLTTTVPYLDITAPGNDSAPNGEVTVRANTTAGCQASAPATVQFQIGIGGADFSSSATYYGYVCPDGPVVFEITRFNPRGTDLYTWYVNGEYRSNNPGRFQVSGPSVGQSMYVYVVVANNCGAGFEFGQYIYGASEIDGFPCQVNRQVQTEPVAAYPNPANNKLSVEQGGGAVTLRNSHSRLVLHETAKPGRVQLNTNQLPNGLYFLEFTNAAGTRVRQQIQIEH